MGKYLNEDTYRKGKKGLTVAAIIVIAIGLIVGGFLIFTGINKMNGDNGATITELKEEKSRLKEEMIPYQTAKNEEFKKNGFSEEYYRLDNKLSELREEIVDIESEIFEKEHGFSQAENVPFFIFGGFIIFASLIFGGSLFMMANRRGILAFSAQQVMPIVKEGVDELTPTIKKVGKEMAPVYGDVAKEISKGIKEGLKEDKK